ncbi:MAG: glycosyltransferase family 4 protein, partial [Candidatus Marinimicrobia bacterium]|nr:glycosyltransferase family 4 protein [Candidatus Neomarinimicrobiota bacterium]
HLSAQYYREGLFTVIYNGIDPQKFTYRRNRSGALKAQLGIHDLGAPIIGFIGRLAEQKRPDHFLKVIKMITGEHPNVIGLVVGDGDWRGRLEALVKSLGLEDNVILTGVRSDIPHILSILDVLVMTSQQEGFSVAILEAMSAGVPVVATDVGGNAEVITHGMDGFIHPFGDIAGLSGSVLQLLRYQASSGRVGAAARKRVAGHFTTTRMVGQTADLYESLLPAKR